MCRVRASLSPSERGLSERDLQCQAGRNGLAKINSVGHELLALAGGDGVFTPVPGGLALLYAGGKGPGGEADLQFIEVQLFFGRSGSSL